MSSLPLTSSSGSNSAQRPNPFARALSNETEQSLLSGQAKSPDQSTNPFAQALANAGGSMVENSDFDSTEPEIPAETSWEQAARERTEAHRARHTQFQIEEDKFIALYDQAAASTAAQLEQTRREVQALIMTSKIRTSEPELVNAVFTPAVQPGRTGAGESAYLQHIRRIATGKIVAANSSASWATELKGKKSRASKIGPNIFGAGQRETTTVHDMMDNSEKNTNFSGS